MITKIEDRKQLLRIAISHLNIRNALELKHLSCKINAICYKLKQFVKYLRIAITLKV
jgi:hypothetical protein